MHEPFFPGLIKKKWRQVSSCYFDSWIPHAVWRENYCTKPKYICMQDL